MATFTDGISTITPRLVPGYESEAAHGNIVHPLLGSAYADVTLRPAQLTTGDMTLIFDAAADALAAELALRTPAVWMFTDDDVASVAMTFVVRGRVRRILSDSRRTWSVVFGWQEV